MAWCSSCPARSLSPPCCRLTTEASWSERRCLMLPRTPEKSTSKTYSRAMLLALSSAILNSRWCSERGENVLRLNPLLESQFLGHFSWPFFVITMTFPGTPPPARLHTHDSGCERLVRVLLPPDDTQELTRSCVFVVVCFCFSFVVLSFFATLTCFTTTTTTKRYLRHHNPDPSAPNGVRPSAVQTFVKSTAGYCVITYLVRVVCFS